MVTIDTVVGERQGDTTRLLVLGLMATTTRTGRRARDSAPLSWIATG